MYFFTICSNNYLAQAKILGNSIARIYPGNKFLIALVDEKSSNIDYSQIPYEIIEVKNIVPEIDDLSFKYNIIELNTAVKPGVIEYLFAERKVDSVIYLDPDIKIISPLKELEESLLVSNIVLTPHIFSVIPLDDKKPSEVLFLKYGIYNLGFIAVKRSRESTRFVSWWKERTYKIGFDRTHEGLFVDQLPINLVPLLFEGVHILHHKGYNVAPWNIQERYLTKVADGYHVNAEENLRFFHFSSFRVDSNELPKQYSRFLMSERPDLWEIYNMYNEEMKSAGYNFYSKIPCTYVIRKKEYIDYQSSQAWKKKPVIRKLAITISKMIPVSFRNQLAKIGNL